MFICNLSNYINRKKVRKSISYNIQSSELKSEMFTGQYKGIIYSVQHKQNTLLGAYYDIQLIIGEKVSRERELNLIRAIDKLAERLKAWVIEEEIIIMRPEQSQELIKKWNELSKQ